MSRSSQTATNCVAELVLREQLITLIVGAHVYTAEHVYTAGRVGQAVHTVLESKCLKAAVWLLMLPNPGATKK